MALLLHFILQPNNLIRAAGNKKPWKLSCAASQESFLIHVTISSDVLVTIERRANMYKDMGLGCQPYMIVVGPTLHELSEFFVSLDNILYKYNSFIQALDSCFKINTIINLKYALESELVWIFVENFFFEKIDSCSANY